MTEVITRTDNIKVLKVGKPFKLGFCACGCGEEINIKTRCYLRKYAFNHQSPKGEKHYNWKGGKILDKNGYVIIYSFNHPFKTNSNYVRQHRLIYEHYLRILFDEDIYIPKEIDIHHIDGNVQNNSLINLQSLTKSEHMSITNGKDDIKNRTCCNLKCKRPKETYRDKNGYLLWSIYDKEKELFLCSRCERERRRGKEIKIYS